MVYTSPPSYHHRTLKSGFLNPHLQLLILSLSEVTSPKWEESSVESVGLKSVSGVTVTTISHSDSPGISLASVMCCILRPALSLSSSQAALGSCLVVL